MPPRRHRGEGSLYQRKSDGLYIGTVDVSSPDGRRIRRQVSSKSKAGAIRKLRELRKTVEEFGDVPKGVKVEAWLTYWLTNIAAPRTKPRTMQGYRTTVTQHLIPYLGRKRLDQLTPANVRDLHRALEDKGLAAGTILKAHRILAKSLTDAYRDGRVTRNVATMVDAPRKSARPREGLTAEEAKTLLRSVAHDRLGSRWAAALLLGARQGELLGLEWDRVNLDEGFVDLAWQLQRLNYRHGCGTRPVDRLWPCGKVRAGSCPKRTLDVRPGFEYRQLDGGLCLTRPKSSAGERLIPLPLALAQALIARKAAAEPSPHNLVWTREDGRPIDPSHDYHAWIAALDAAGLPRTPLHSARHTTATLLLELGVDAKVIAAILGHSDVVVTRGYQHVRDPLARASMDALGRLLAIEGSDSGE